MPRQTTYEFNRQILAGQLFPQLLIEVELVTGTTYLRYALGLENITWNSQTWTAFPAEMGDYEETVSSKMPEVTIIFSAVDGSIITQLDSYDGLRDKKVRLILIFMSKDSDGYWQPIEKIDDSGWRNYQEATFYIDSTEISASDFMVRCRARPKMPSGVKIPGRSFHGNYCQWPYRGWGCGYDGENVPGPNGETDYCQHDLSTDYGCLASPPTQVGGGPRERADTTLQSKWFGGFPGIVRPETWSLY